MSRDAWKRLICAYSSSCDSLTGWRFTKDGDLDAVRLAPICPKKVDMVPCVNPLSIWLVAVILFGTPLTSSIEARSLVVLSCVAICCLAVENPTDKVLDIEKLA